MEAKEKIGFTSSEITKSRKNALQKIIGFLESENVEEQFQNRSGGYYSDEKFIVTWKGNYNGIPSEYGLDKTDSFYKNYSGYAAIYVTRSLFHEKQLQGFSTIERGLIEIGLKLCSGRSNKENFYNKYAVPYNRKLQGKNLK